MSSIHDASFGLSPRPPFAFGQSPFHVRGAIFKVEIARAEKVVPGGLAAITARIGDPQLDAFLQRPISPAGWYDVQPLAYVGHTAAKLLRISFDQYARELGIDHARVAFDGFSGVVLRVLSHETLAMWLPRISAWFHDFGDVQTASTSPGLVRGVRTGVPRFLVHAWAITACEFAEEMLRRAGAKSPRVHTLAPEADGSREGHDTFRIPFEVCWQT
jgi:hypothetical protein